MLQQQCFRFGMRDGDVYMMDVTDQHLCLSTADMAAKVAAEALFEIFGFSYIDHGVRGIVHAVHARLTGHRAEKGFGVENFTHY